MSANIANLITEFIKVNNKLTYIQKKPLHLVAGIIVTTASVHLLEAIEKRPKRNLSELAHSLGVTRGNISQQSKKLLEQGLIIKKNKENNNKEIYFELTSEGQGVYCAHEVLHRALYTTICQELSTFSEADTDKITLILQQVGAAMDEYQEQLKG